MSLPEPINWLHMSSAEYIYFVSTKPLSATESTDIFLNFPESSNKSMTTEMKQRFWNFNDWEVFTDKEKAIERAKQICWPTDKIVDKRLFREGSPGDQQSGEKTKLITVKDRRKLSIKEPYPSEGVEVLQKWGVMNPQTEKWTRQTYVVRVKTGER